MNPLSLLGPTPVSSITSSGGAEGTRIVAIERETGRGREYETESMFVFHSVNAFEDASEIVLDVLAYEDAGVVNCFRFDELERELPNLQARLMRIRIRSGGDSRCCGTLTAVRFEFPSINYRRFTGKNYKMVLERLEPDRGGELPLRVREGRRPGWRVEALQSGGLDLRGASLCVPPARRAGGRRGSCERGKPRPADHICALVVLDAAGTKAWAEVPLAIPGDSTALPS